MTYTRRGALKLLGTGVVVGGAFTTGAAAANHGFAAQLNTVREATRKYRDVSLARPDGYDELSPYVPGMGFHFEDPDRFAADENAAHDLTNPAVLLYVTTGNYNPAPFQQHDPNRDDDLVLAAAEFVHEGTPGAAADYFLDEEGARNVRTSEEEGWSVIPGTGHTGLHVWVHRGNPDGVFAPFNKTVD